ncbi:hypothetical protein J6590_090742 [Homalodisca vitripennis]|nr:hypothetical protein J6590_090742 [Homalodisca vitripennis]
MDLGRRRPLSPTLPIPSLRNQRKALRHRIEQQRGGNPGFKRERWFPSSAQTRINVKPKAEAKTAPMINGSTGFHHRRLDDESENKIKGRRQHLL